MANRKVRAELEIDGKDNTSAAFRSVATRMGEIEKRIAAFNRTAKDFNKMSAGFSQRAKDIEKAADTIGKRHVAITRATEGMASAMGEFLAPAALGAGVVYVTKKAADFEESLSNIQKKAGATTAQMTTMRGEIMSLGREMPVGLDEIAKGFERGAAAGIPLSDLKEFAKLSVQVSDAWSVSAEESANFFAGFHASMGIEYGQKMKNYASLINDLADSGIADERDIGDFIDRAGAPLKNFGMTPEQIAAYGAAMLNLKMPSEVAARAMNTLSSALIAPENLSKKAGSALDAIVGDAEKFRKMSGDQKMIYFINRLHDMTAQRRASLLGGLLGTGFSDEIARLVAGSDEVARNLQMAQRETAQASTSVERVYDQRMKTFNAQVKRLQNNINELSVTAGNLVLPGANAALTFVNGSISKGMSVRDLRAKAFAGMDHQQQIAQERWYRQRYQELYGTGFSSFRNAGLSYNDAVLAVGSGQFKDVYDYLRNQQYLDNENKRAAGRLSMPPRIPGAAGKSMSQPATLLGDRAVFRVSDIGYQQYHQGQQAMHDSQLSGGWKSKIRDHNLLKAGTATGGRVIEALAWLAGRGDGSRPNNGFPSVAEFHAAIDRREASALQGRNATAMPNVRSSGFSPTGLLAPIGEHPSKDELPQALKVDEQSATEAARAVAQGGKEGAAAIGDAARQIREAGLAAASAIAQAVADFAKTIAGAKAAGAASRPVVNADTGKSNTFASAPPSGTTGGGGW